MYISPTKAASTPEPSKYQNTTLKRSEPSSGTLQNPRTSHTLQKLDFLKTFGTSQILSKTLQNHAAAFQT